MSYDDHSNLLINYTTEFAGSYVRNFRKLGINTKCVISNDTILQNKWRSENCETSVKMNEILFKQIEDFMPDILWIESLSYLNASWFKKVRKEIKTVKLIIAYHCAPYTKELIEKLREADFIITCTPGLKKNFENEGLKTYLVYHGFDEDLLTRIERKGESPANDLVFSGSLITGSHFHNIRIDLIENLIKENIDLSLYVTLEKNCKIRAKQLVYILAEILKKLKMKWLTDRIPIFQYGQSPVKSYSEKLMRSNHQPLYGIDMFNLFQKSKIVLNLHTGIAGDYAGNMRMFEVTGIGSCLLTDNKKNMNDLFEVGTEVMVYDSPEDCIEKIRWLLEHDDERETIALLGHKKTMEMHTVENRCKSIIDIIIKELLMA